MANVIVVSQAVKVSGILFFKPVSTWLTIDGDQAVVLQ